MPIVQKEPMSRTSITIVVLLILCVAGFAYSQGWFNWSSSSNEVESNNVGTEQRMDQETIKGDALPVTQQTSESAAGPAE